VVDGPTLAASVVICPPEPPPRMRPGRSTQPPPQRRVGIGRSLRRGQAPLGAPVLPGDPAGEPFADPQDRHQMVHGCPPSLRAQKFPLAISLSAAFSSSASASSRLSVEFSRSRSLSRLASSAFSPPNWLRHR